MAMTRVASARWFSSVALGALVLTGCSGSGDSTTGEAKQSGNFVVLRTDPVNAAQIYLNDPIRIDFSRDVDPDSANLNTVSFQVLDQLGQPTSELVSGSFSIDTSPGDSAPGRRLLFTPRFATNNNYDDGGFRGGRTYLVQLVSGDRLNGTSLRATDGRALLVPLTFSFSTVEGTSPAQLFRNPMAGGPRRAPSEGLTISNWPSLDNVPLNLFGAPPTEIRLSFDQALNPNDGNVPVNFDPDPVVRSQSQRGNVFLEYDDPELGNNTWIPTDVELERNDLTGATLVLRPSGVLPNNATIRVIVEPDLEDISGESNAGNLSYNRVFGSFSTEQAFDQQWNGIAERFTSSDDVNFNAPFPEPQAEVGPGYIKAGFAFEGSNTSLEFEPNVLEVVLNTSFTQVVPKNGLPFNVAGGVFNFKNVRIPQGVLVKGQGPNPMVWLCTGDFIVDGHLSVDGGRGARVDTLNSANFAKAGGVGTCGGGNGGPGTPSGSSRDLRGGNGNGPLQVPGLGGGGGRLACLSGCYTGSGYNGSGGGSGGGGGTMATQGDPNFDTNSYTGTQFRQKFGEGGAGCSGGSGTRTAVLAGGEAGARIFVDSREDNNFWGSGIDLSRNIRITGELSTPMGGGGGGGGGDTAHNTSCNPLDPSFANDYSGGGGGGGGGALIIKALGEIVISSSGKITADGGLGGGGEQVGACGEAGGGGAGAGGLIVLMSAKKIRIHAHSTSGRYTFRGDPSNTNNDTTNKNYDFAISADGGVCTTGTFGNPVVQKKYPNNGQQVINGTSYDANPLGALGGMGIVQLMTPPGDNSDGTNTILDDNIEIVLPPLPPEGIDKRTMIGWRGMPDETGVYRDDFGNVIPSTFGAGDIRPMPTLLPVPFNSKSRVRSKWLDTGASRRRLLAAPPDNDPRAMLDDGSNVAGPVYEFAGLELQSNSPGYVRYEPLGESAVKVLYPVAVPATSVVDINPSASYLGQPAYGIELASPALGDEANRYVQYEAELLNISGSVIGSMRIVSHNENSLLLAGDGNLLPNGIDKLLVRAKFFKVTTNGSEGLGPIHLDGNSTPVPNSNVRIGFAFHQDPSQPTGRYPANPQDFVFDMNDAGLQSWIQQNGAPAFVQWDVVFDMVFEIDPPTSRSLGPSSPRPALEYLRIPFRF